MSLTGFLFGNVDEEGHLSDNELDDELRNTLGGEDANNYLSGILGSALFSDGVSKRGNDDEEDEEEESAGRASTPAIKPKRDAIDYSDFNELAADDASVPRKEKWAGDGLGAGGFKFGTPVERAQVDDDYDDEDDDVMLPAATGVEAEQGEFAGGSSDEEILEDLFDSPEIKPADRAASGRPTSSRLTSPEEEDEEEEEEETEEEAVVPRPAKRIIPSGLI
ncbi:hypothetical protein IWW38_006526, partial [Coemansia aciculifera]